MVTILPILKVFKPVKKFPIREEPFSFEHEYKRFQEVFGIVTTKRQTKNKNKRIRTTKKNLKSNT